MKNIVVKNNLSKKDKIISHKEEVNVIVDKKIKIFRDVIQKTILHVQKANFLIF